MIDHRPGVAAHAARAERVLRAALEALRRELRLPDARPCATRRNAFVRGVDLNALVGAEFQVQGVRFAGAEQCSPCHWMDVALAPGAEQWLKDRGGLRARILTDGILQREVP